MSVLSTTFAPSLAYAGPNGKSVMTWEEAKDYANEVLPETNPVVEGTRAAAGEVSRLSSSAKEEGQDMWNNVQDQARNVDTTSPTYGAAKEGYGSAKAGADETEGTVKSKQADIESEQDEDKRAAKAGEKPKADTPDTPTVSNKANLDANQTDADSAIDKNVAGAKLPVLRISEDGKTVESVDEDADDAKKSDLAAINNQLLKEAVSQQENQTSTNAAQSYQVQTSTGETVVVTKNPCYQKTTDQACMQNYSYSWVDENGNRQSAQVPLSTLEYLAGSTKVTYDMIQQARRQEAFTNATKNALSDTSSSALKVNPVESVTSSIRDMIAYGADPKQALLSGLLAYESQMQSADTIKNVKEYGKAMQEIEQAKNNAVYSKTEDAQKAAGVLSAQKNKRFTPRLIPSIPVVNSEDPIRVSLVTSSGKINDEKEYTVYAKVRNQKTGKIQRFKVYENTPFIVELPEWTVKPGRRNVEIIYEFTNSAVKESYSFSYNVGQLATAILPSGKAVSNSVTALAGNKDILNYNMMGQAVAGRVRDTKWDNGMCFMEMTDAKDDSNLKYPTVVVASDKISESSCGTSLKNRYVSMANVTAKYDENGQYVFVDNSDGDQVSIMDEAGYDSLEDDVAAKTQYEGDKWDKNTLKVSDDGTIYETLPGKLGINFVNLNVGNGKKVNVAVAVDAKTGKYSFAKADGTKYTDAELQAKGIDPSVISVGINPNTSLLTAYDRKTGKVISNNAFDASDTSNLSRSVTDATLDSANTSATLTNSSLSNSLGNSTGKAAGQVISTFTSLVSGTAKAVVSMTGNVGSIGSGTFASLESSTLGGASPFSNVQSQDAQVAALKVCATVPDRCDEAMNAAK